MAPVAHPLHTSPTPVRFTAPGAPGARLDGCMFRAPPRRTSTSSKERPAAMAEQPKTASDVLKIANERNVRFVRLWFTDVLGQLKSFSINAQELDDAFEGGMGFDGSSITGFNPIEESDMIAMPDA